MRIEDQIKHKASELGFDAVKIVSTGMGEREQKRLHQFVRNGEHGDMAWMAENLDRREHPRGIWPETKSIIVLASNYGPDHDPLDTLNKKNIGNISVYARNRDYHNILKKRQRKLARWMVESFSCDLKIFVDTAPVLEKPLAARSGMGWQGKHSNLVSQEFGSWFFLCEIFTDLKLQPDDPIDDHCGTCSRCIDICPTDAITKPYQVDARRCISYLTIEHKGHIPEELRGPMGNRIYGCDDCLAVCPWNKFAQKSQEAGYIARAELNAPALANLVKLDDPSFRELFTGSPIKRTGRDRFIRNVLIALANSGEPAFAGHAVDLLDDSSPLVRAMAVWAVSRLSPNQIEHLYRAKFDLEEDSDVRGEWTKALSRAGVNN